MDNHIVFMKQALALAEQAAEKGEVPVGAVVVADGEVIGKGFNCPIGSSDPTAHAEIVALRDAAKNIENYRLAGCDLYVTIEPCTMCVGAMIHARINRIIFGAPEPRAGALTSQLALLDADHFNHAMKWTGGILEDQCRALMKDFFKQRR
ncbi:MAG: tRNA adenosine(34) deaminase TadA [Porticoccaceae bacterium]